MVEFNLIRSKRRSISIEIHAHEIRVRAPTWVSRHEINSFVQSRAAWIAKHLEAQHARTPPPARNYLDGDVLLYLGQTLTLRHHSGRGRPVLSVDAGTLTISTPPGNPARAAQAPLPPRGTNLDLFTQRRTDTGVEITSPERDRMRKRIADWYKSQALELLTQRSQEYAHKMDVTFQRIRVAEFKRQWGSCGPTGVLSYNWLLLMAPLPIIDYIVVHELAHLRHANHGKRFWALVARHYPEYMEARRWLRENHEQLRL